jgi:predicted esterase
MNTPRCAATAAAFLAVTLAAGSWAAPTRSSPPKLSRRAGAKEKPALDLKPGQTNLVEDSRCGSYLVYVPADYTPDRAWPVIVYMHGMGGKPNLGPFRKMFDGKTFIIVGHEYVFRSKAEENHETEADNLMRVVATVSKNLNVDRKRLILGGFSQGGWWTTMLAEHTMKTWAALFTLGSGEHASKSAQQANVRGKPVFIGAGEKDSQFLPMARDSVTAYQSRGAKVTFEWFPGVGHTDAVSKSEKLRNFLLSVGTDGRRP